MKTPRHRDASPPRPEDLKGRVAVVTGATSGIGRAVAEGLARRGATTVVVGRGEARTAEIAAEIARDTLNPHVEPLPVTDLALLGEVRRVATVLLERYPRIHLLINNAGAYYARRQVTPEGSERTFALNVVAPFVLTSLLERRLSESAPSRVVQLASQAHLRQEVDFSNLQSAQRYRGLRAYARSKLELILLTREFAHRYQGHGITFLAVHPGFVASRFGQNNEGTVGFLFRLAEALFAIPVQRGAERVLAVALDPAFESANGQYVVRGNVHPGSPASQDPMTALRLVRVLEGVSAGGPA